VTPPGQSGRRFCVFLDELARLTDEFGDADLACDLTLAIEQERLEEELGHSTQHVS
jgi:hypothetical protein